MATGGDLVPDPDGIAELLKLPGLGDDLASRAQAIADVAGPGHEVRAMTGRRARASVVTVTYEAMLAEARNRNLTRAIDAGRD
jgi:hypothetical protein